MTQDSLHIAEHPGSDQRPKCVGDQVSAVKDCVTETDGEHRSARLDRGSVFTSIRPSCTIYCPVSNSARENGFCAHSPKYEQGARKESGFNHSEIQYCVRFHQGCNLPQEESSQKRSDKVGGDTSQNGNHAPLVVRSGGTVTNIYSQ
jgi:hypothetical protein